MFSENLKPVSYIIKNLNQRRFNWFRFIWKCT